jgi:hypothetical protein
MAMSRLVPLLEFNREGDFLPNLEFQNGDARSDLSASPIKTPAALL